MCVLWAFLDGLYRLRVGRKAGVVAHTPCSLSNYLDKAKFSFPEKHSSGLPALRPLGITPVSNHILKQRSPLLIPFRTCWSVYFTALGAPSQSSGPLPRSAPLGPSPCWPSPRRSARCHPSCRRRRGRRARRWPRGCQAPGPAPSAR